MRRFNDDSGQLILLACVSVVVAIVLIAIYGLSTLETGEKSINREDMNSYYYYGSIRDRYFNAYKNLNYDSDDLNTIETEMKGFAILHGYSVDFIRNSTQTRIIFVDKDLRIEEVIEK